MRSMLLFPVLVSTALLSGCGTVLTLSASDHYIAHSLAERKTYCERVPRLYSGATYDFCLLHGAPDPNQRSAPVWNFLDIAFSGVTDTLVLPYTAWQQHKQGDIFVTTPVKFPPAPTNGS